MKIMSIIFFFLLFGCARSSNSSADKSDSVEIYYRGFDSTSAFTLSPDDVIEVSDTHLLFTDKHEIRKIAKIFNLSCEKSMPKNMSIDSRLVVIFQNQQGMQRKINASRFFFHYTKNGKSCVLSPDDKNAITKFLEPSSVDRSVNPAAGESKNE